MLENLRTIKTDSLIFGLKSLVGDERKILAQILDGLREVEFRRIYLKMGYPTLYDFCVKELGYQEASAYRRIAAMRLIKELPQIGEKIVSGTLSLTAVAQAQTYFKKKERADEHIERKEKIEILAQFENLSTRECEKVLVRLDPESAKKDKVRVITEDLTEIRLTVGPQFTRMLERLRQLTSHSNPTATNAQLLELAMVELLKRKDPLLKKDGLTVDLPRQIPSEGTITSSKNSDDTSGDIFNGKNVICVNSKGEHVDPDEKRKVTPAPELIQKQMRKSHRYIPTAMRVHIMKKFNGQCCYIDPKTGKRCESKRFIQVDHVHPVSKGGGSRINNLQLLCAGHNQWKGAAIERAEVHPQR